MHQSFLWNIEDGIGWLRFNRPARGNALRRDGCGELIRAIDQVEAGAVRALVITGEGKFFSAGADIGEFEENSNDVVPVIDEFIQLLHPAMLRLASLPVPVISAVNGPLGGAGIAFALCADFVLASDGVKLRGGYCALGLTPDVGASYFLTRRVGAAKAKEIFMLNRAYSADDCLRLGIVDQVCPAAQLNETVAALAAELARGPRALGWVKQLCDQAQDNDLARHLDREHVVMLKSARTQDFQEGLSAFIEKRSPRFSGS